jgi:hypothetical protein
MGPPARGISVVRKNQPGSHLPTHYIRPLMDQNRQIAIGLDPIFYYVDHMMVSEVGRTKSGSSSFFPPPLVTTAHCGAKPSTAWASRVHKIFAYDTKMK